MNKKDGKDLEILVQMIERSISPDSIVEHDVQMPILNSREGHTTQCDIVIRTGKKPRETITIVEVQDRNKQVMLNDFRGWKQKLEDVGAQHLICVSRKEFSANIKEQAIMSGGSIRLVTLKELNTETLPINILFKYRKFDITEASLTLAASKSETEKLGIRQQVLKRINTNSFDINEKCFSLDKEELISAYMICRDYYVCSNEIGESSGAGEVLFDRQSNMPLPLYFFESGCFTSIEFKCNFKWNNMVIEKPATILSYKQDEYGALVWVADMSYQSPEGFVSLKCTFTKSDCEEAYLARFMHIDCSEDIELVISKMVVLNSE